MPGASQSQATFFAVPTTETQTICEEPPQFKRQYLAASRSRLEPKLPIHRTELRILTRPGAPSTRCADRRPKTGVNTKNRPRKRVDIPAVVEDRAGSAGGCAVLGLRADSSMRRYAAGPSSPSSQSSSGARTVRPIQSGSHSRGLRSLSGAAMPGGGYLLLMASRALIAEAATWSGDSSCRAGAREVGGGDAVGLSGSAGGGVAAGSDSRCCCRSRAEARVGATDFFFLAARAGAAAAAPSEPLSGSSAAPGDGADSGLLRLATPLAGDGGLRFVGIAVTVPVAVGAGGDCREQSV